MTAQDCLSQRTRKTVDVVRTMHDFMQVVAVRAIVYMSGQHCPYDEEYDGNDFCGMHLLGRHGDEPVACLRIRFFADFAKIERLAVRPEFRRSSIAFAIVRHALRIIARKGYTRVYGHAQEGLESFWARFGAREFSSRASFSFSGYRYTEMLLELPREGETIAVGSDPLLIIRPEGEWDQPGVLEQNEPFGPDFAHNSDEAAPPPTGSGHSERWSEATMTAWKKWSQACGVEARGIIAGDGSYRDARDML